jgi:hypothetical protein
MADKINGYKVALQGGIVTGYDVFTQAEQVPGGALVLVNYEPAVNGGYRRINGYANTYGTVPGTGAVLGVAVNEALNAGVFAWRENGTTNEYFYRWNGTTWTAITVHASIVDAGITKVRYVNLRWGVDKMVFVDGVNFAQVYDGTNCTRINSTLAPAKPKYVTSFANHLFLAGDDTQPYSLYFSAPLNESDFNPANGAGVINVGFEIVQIKAFRDELYIFGKNRIKKLVGTNLADFVLRDVTTNLGCLAPDSVVEVAGNLVFLTRDGFRPVSGTDRIGDVELASLSPQIKDKMVALITDIVEGDLLPEAFSAVTVNDKTQFRLLNNSESVTGFLGGLRQTMNSSGFEYSLLNDFQASCAASGYIGLNELVLHGGVDGKVFEQEVGSNFDGRSILSVYQTPYHYFDDPTIRKQFYSVSTFMRANGNVNIALGVKYNFEDTGASTLNPTNYALTTEGAAAFFNEAVYDATATYDGNPSPVVKNNIEGSGFAISLRYVAFDTNPSHVLQGIVILYTPDDRR